MPRTIRQRLKRICAIGGVLLLMVLSACGTYWAGSQAWNEYRVAHGESVLVQFEPQVYYRACSTTIQKGVTAKCYPFWGGSVLRAGDVVADDVAYRGHELAQYGPILPQETIGDSTPFLIAAKWVPGTSRAYSVTEGIGWWKTTLLAGGLALLTLVCCGGAVLIAKDEPKEGSRRL